MEAVFLKLLNMSIAASWLVLAILILRMLLRKVPKTIRCASVPVSESTSYTCHTETLYHKTEGLTLYKTSCGSVTILIPPLF